MTTSQKIKLSPSRDIPFNKLVLSQANVRRVKAGVSIERLAESIAQRTLLQSLSVRAVVDTDGQETGMYDLPAGGRRFRALKLLVEQKRMTKTQPVPCVVRIDGVAEDDSLAENDERFGAYNRTRPHSALGYLTPAAYAASLTATDDRLRNPDQLRRSSVAQPAHLRQSQSVTLASTGWRR